MSRRPCLSDSEKSKIVSMLAEGHDAKSISTEIGRDPRTVKKFIDDPMRKVTRKDKGKWKVATRRNLSRIKRELKRNSTATRGEIFKSAGMEEVPKTTRCRILRSMASHVSPVIRPPLKESHKKARVSWAEKYLKTDFQTVLFTDEMRATLDGPDGWAKSWTAHGSSRPQRIRRQQGGGGVMMWAGILGDRLVGPFRVPEGVKITSANYISFLKNNFVPWLKRQPAALKKKIIFMHDNAPSHAATATRSYLETLKFSDDKLMVWPSLSPDLNPIENLWSILKQKLYAGGRQFTNKEDLWREIEKICEKITPDTINKLTSSMDRRLLRVVDKRGGFTGY